MRWDDLTVAADEQARLPGYREAAVVRHFDAPEALDTRFYEVRARSLAAENGATGAGGRRRRSSRRSSEPPSSRGIATRP